MFEHLLRDHLIVNIGQPENTPGGLAVVNRDPRKQEQRPDAYVGVVERVGPLCDLVKVGDKVVVERWEYTQFDVDEERLLPRQIDVLVLEGGKVAPGCVAIQVEPEKKLTDLAVPDTYIPERTNHFFGKVTSSSEEDLKEGEYIWLTKSDSYQYRLGRNTVVFRYRPGMVVMKLNVDKDLKVSNTK